MTVPYLSLIFQHIYPGVSHIWTVSDQIKEKSIKINVEVEWDMKYFPLTQNILNFDTMPPSPWNNSFPYFISREYDLSLHFIKKNGQCPL